MIKTTRILLLEDDVNLRSVIADYLHARGFVVDACADGQEGWEILSKKHYDLLLSDIVMPRMDGFELLKVLRDSNNPIPVLFLTERSDKEDIVRAYQLGCDDYMIKPFSMEILVLKIESIMKRYRAGQQDGEMEFDLAGVHFDGIRQRLGGKHLSSRENELLLMLCQNMNNLVERNRILMSLWGTDTYFNSRSLSVYVNHLRNYFGENSLVRIMSVHGKGYKLVIMREEDMKAAEAK